MMCRSWHFQYALLAPTSVLLLPSTSGKIVSQHKPLAPSEKCENFVFETYLSISNAYITIRMWRKERGGRGKDMFAKMNHEWTSHEWSAYRYITAYIKVFVVLKGSRERFNKGRVFNKDLLWIRSSKKTRPPKRRLDLLNEDSTSWGQVLTKTRPQNVESYS